MSEGISLSEQLEKPKTHAGATALSVAESAVNAGAKLIEVLVREQQAVSTPAQPSEAERAERKRLQELKDKMQLEEAQEELKLINYPREQALNILGKENEAEPTPVANARTEYQSLLDKIAPQGSPNEPQRPVSIEPRDFVQQQAMGIKSAIGAPAQTETVSAPP